MVTKKKYTQTQIAWFLTRNVTVYVYYTMLWSTSCRIDVYSRHYNFGRNLRIQNTVLACAIVISSTGLANLAIFNLMGTENNSALRKVITTSWGCSKLLAAAIGFWSPRCFLLDALCCAAMAMHLLTPEEAEIARTAQKQLLLWFSLVSWQTYTYSYLVVT